MLIARLVHVCAETLNIFPSQPMHVEPSVKVCLYLQLYGTLIFFRTYVQIWILIVN
jgi:hypothetical protein